MASKSFLFNFYSIRRTLTALLAAASVAPVTGCFDQPKLPADGTATNGGVASAASTDPGAQPSGSPFQPAPGARAAKIIFKQSFPSGSFDAPQAGGTPANPGSGLSAVRVFNADGTLLASGGPSTTNWPKWLTKVEIGISGTNNLSATNPDCARFASPTESSQTQCNFGDGAGSAKCGADSGLFRVSEYDCAKATPTTGNGGPGDGIYIRAFFSRDPQYLAMGENILAVIEFAASALNPTPSAPTACFSNGQFKPENCSDMTWKAFIKHDASEIVQPYLLLVPPTFGYVNTAAKTGGSGIAARQFYLPLGGDPNLQVLQLSRIQGLGDSTTYKDTCSNGAGVPANSPLCVGMIIYSLTFYRI